VTRPSARVAGRIFVDTAAFYGLADPGDSCHPAAVALARQLSTAPVQLVTTNFVVAETHALLLIRQGYATALRFLDELAIGTLAVVSVSATDEERAQAIIRRYTDKSYSYTDASSFAVMERLDIAQAFTFDRNFLQHGLTMLPPM
jgi:predicted nucleic acid-binding protein